MAFIDFQKWVGIDVDQYNLIMSAKQPNGQAAKCHAFEKEWLECADGLGEIRAKRECKLELEDLHECMMLQKTVSSRRKGGLSKAGWLLSARAGGTNAQSHE